MKAKIINHTKDTPGCDFEEWSKSTHSMAKCGGYSVATIGSNFVCIDHLPHMLLCTPNLDMQDIPKDGCKHGEIIIYKEDFLKAAKENINV